MRHHVIQADAKFKKLSALAALAGGGGGGGGGGAALSRYKYISGDTTETTQNGAIGTPFKTYSEFLASVAASASIADASAMVVGKVTPSLAGYTETLVLPPYRNVELRSDNWPTPLVGNITLHNAAGAGTHVPPLALYVLHNQQVTGSLTVTDDGLVPSEIFISCDEAEGGLFFIGSIDTHTATAVAAVVIDGITVTGAINCGVASTSATVAVEGGGQVNGAIHALVVSALLSTFGGSITTGIAGGSTAMVFNSCGFASAPVLTGTAGSFASFDGVSWRNFITAGGTVAAAGLIVVVVGGYLAGPVEGHALPTTGTTTAVSINGTGATAAFTQGGNHYTSAGLAADGAVVHVLTGGGEHIGDTLLVTKSDLAAHALTVTNNAGTTIGVIPASSRGSIMLQMGASDWALATCGSLAA